MAFLDAIHPERHIDGFSKLSGTLTFYSFVRAIMLRHGVKNVLDFGAGRGETFDSSEALNTHLRDLRFNGARVCACDVDTAVKTHPRSHEQVVISPNVSLPFPDGAFDLIVSDMTFEHITDPEFVAAELLRVLKPGGYICARTPNKYGYVAILSRLTPNARHVGALRHVQPDRKAQDVFPTAYKMNTPQQVRRLFPSCETYCITASAEPAYYFGNAFLYRALLVMHRFLPPVLDTTLFFFIHKP
ncbi:MAG: methyltransferase domain-containing protein [Rhizomicrobium sp.]